jgi:hypothetical protein
LYITNIKYNYAAIKLIDPFRLSFNNIFVNTNGTGIYFGVDPALTTHYGNSQFNHIQINLMASNAIGLDLESGTTYVLNLMQWTYVDVLGGTLLTNTTGIRLAGVQTSEFSHIDIEFPNTGIELLSSAAPTLSLNNVFTNVQIYNAQQYAMVFHGGGQRNCVYGGSFSGVNSSVYLIADENWWSTTYERSQNLINGVQLGPVGRVDLSWDTITVDCPFFNPVGVVVNPFGTILNMPIFSVSQGWQALPDNGTWYRAAGTDWIVNCTGGTGVSITVADPSGNYMITGASSLNMFSLPLGYQLKMTWSASPTMLCYAN